MDPVRNPYAPGAGQRPPELAGRDRQRSQFDVTLERIAAGRPERSMVLSGLRGVGKTVLLNTLRSQAVGRAWGTGKLEARPEHGLRLPLAQALHAAIRELAHRHRDPDRVDEVLGVLSAYATRGSRSTARAGGRGTDPPSTRWRLPAGVPLVRGRADSGDLELDLVELLGDVGELGQDLGVGIAVFLDEMQDLPGPDLAALCGACHEMSQQGSPVVVVGAGLPHLPTALSASRSYAERLFRYVAVDRLPRDEADRAIAVPAAGEGVQVTDGALDALHALTDGYPYFIQAYGKSTWDHAVQTPITADDVVAAAPDAEDELAVGFFGARVERATPAEREYLRAMAEVCGAVGDGPVPTADVAAATGRRPQSLSPARDGLIKKGLVYASERGQVAFTVPHFAAYLRGRPA